MAELLAVATGFFMALTSVGGRLASKAGAAAGQTTLVSLLVSTPFFALVLLLPGQLPGPGGLWNGPALAYFAAAGVLSSVVARIMYFRAVDLVGPARLNQLVATDSLFAMATAALLVGERLTGPAMAGVLLITLGVFVIGSEPRTPGAAPAGQPGGAGEPAGAAQPAGVAQPAGPGRRPQLRGVALGLGAAALYALRNTFIRMGLDLVPAPIWGAAVGSAASLAIYAAYLGATGALRGALPRGRSAVGWTAVVGLAYCGAWLTMFYALGHIQVALVTALKNTAPFFSMALAWLLIGKEERLGPRVLVSAAAIVGGVLLVL